jgi:RHS repeat-associated protein
MELGLARNPKPDSLDVLGQSSSEKNGNTPDFHELYDRFFSSNPLQQSEVKLEISQPQFGASTFHPSCAFIQSEAIFETLKIPAAGGFPEYIHQVLTDDQFTLIDLLPSPDSGWRIRVWKRNIAPLTKSGGYYVTTGFENATTPPLTEVIFKRPLGSTNDTTLLWTKKQSGGLAGISTSSHEIVETLDSSGRPNQIRSRQYAGEDTSGPILSEEILDIKERGTQAWNYTIERKYFVSSVDAAGNIGSLTLISSTREDYEDFSLTSAGGELGKKRLVSYTEAFAVSGQSPQTTIYTYLNTPADPLTHGRLQSSNKPDGSWTYNEYTTLSASSPVSRTIEYSGWKDLTMAQRDDARRTITIVDGETTTVESFVADQLVSKSRTKLINGTTETITSQEAWDGTSTAESAWHKTLTAYYLETEAAPRTGRIKWIEHSDGTAENYSYQTVGGNLVMTVRSGAGSRSGIASGREVVTTMSLGNIPIAMVTKDIESNLTIEQWDTDLSYNSGFDRLGRPIKRIYNGDVNDYDIMQYACCGLEESRERNGIIRRYFRDGLKRVYKIEIQASPASPVISDFTSVSGLTTTTSRSIAGVTQFRGYSASSMDGLSHSHTGLSQKSNNPLDRPVTNTVTTHSSSGDTVTVTLADGSTSITSYYLDGRTKAISGSAVPDMSYDYQVHDENSGGKITLVTASGMTSNTFTDLLGREIKIVSSSSGTSNFTYFPTTATVGSRGKLQSMTDADGVAINSLYNSEGEKIVSSRSIPLASGTATLITTTESSVVTDVTLRGTSLGVSLRNVQKISSTGVSEITVNESFASINGLLSGTRSFGVETLNVTSRTTPGGISKLVSYHPDGTSTEQISNHGLPTTIQTKSSTGAVIKGMTSTYDDLQRPLTVTDLRIGTTTYDVDADGLPDITESGRAFAVKNAAGEISRFEYDVMGRTIKSTLPDGSNSYAAYYPNGMPKVTWGSQTYPTWRVYDEQNRLTELHTWKVAPTLTPGSLLLTIPSGSEITTWIYGSTSGHLDRKEYADGKDTSYTYTDAGRLESRVWERGITTTYGYTNGLMTSTDYSDATPDVTITYEALGRQATVTQAIQSQIEYSYNPSNLQLDTETIRYDIDHNGSYEFTRVLDRSQDSLQRDSDWQLKDGGTMENQATYAYSSTDGRLSSVTGGGAISSPQAFDYTYLANSNLLYSLTSPVHTVTNTWESTRDVLDTKENKVGSTLVSGFDYSVNGIGQRTGVSTSGSAFPSLPTWTWDYDALGQVVSADSSVSGFDRAFEYDAIGNRKKSANSLTLPSSDNYTANTLNQYSTIQEGGTGVSPVYDFDGNATAYPLPIAPETNSTLAWDAENRMISSTVGSVTTTYAYDAQSRRIAKTTGTNNTLYVYDAWNCIAEYSGTILSKSHLWGTDLSGSMQGVGGVGGLLLSTDHSALITHAFPTYDGSGNVSEYLTSAGIIAAHYEYDPFGRTILASGSKANDFAYRFSTKPVDSQTGLYYYGYRYYDPVTGRWPSRDPIEESGGVNLYGFIMNNPIIYHDYLGKFAWGPFLWGAAGSAALGAGVNEATETTCDPIGSTQEIDVKVECTKSCVRSDGWSYYNHSSCPANKGFSTGIAEYRCEGNILRSKLKFIKWIEVPTQQKCDAETCVSDCCNGERISVGNL